MYSLLFYHFFSCLVSISLSLFLHFSTPQLLLSQNASVFSAVKAKINFFRPLPPPPTLPHGPPSLSADDSDSGRPLTSQQTSSLASPSLPMECSNTVIFLFIFLNHNHHHHRSSLTFNISHEDFQHAYIFHEHQLAWGAPREYK